MKVETSTEKGPGFSSLTLLFIYMPSLNVLATLLGPRTAGTLGFVWGGVMIIVGVIIGRVLETEEVVLFLMSLGGAMLGLGMILLPKNQGGNKKSLTKTLKEYISSLLPFLFRHFFSLPFLIFTILLPLSPLIFIATCNLTP